MKKQIAITLATLIASGVVIAAIIPLIKPEGSGSKAALALVIKLFPIGIIATIVAFFLSKPKRASDHPTDAQE
jgi:hypothetical protein